MDTRLYMWIHPVLQSVASIIGFVVMYWGWKRFQMTKLNQKVAFPWKKHVFWGTIALVVWALGLGVGVLSAKYGWGAIFITEVHYLIALVLAPLCVTAYATGYVLDRYKKKRQWLPLIHGANNAVLCFLILVQMYTGYKVVMLYLVF